MSSDPRSHALAALTRFQVTEVSVGDTLERIAAIAVDAIPAAEFVGMTMLGDDGQPTTAIYTDETSPEVDAAQYRDGRGPCLDAWRERRTVRVDRLAECTAEYPSFTTAALEHGVRSTLSLPLVSGETGLGAMNVYARVEHAFSADDEELGSDLAAAAAVVLANVTAYWTAFELSQQLSEAMQTRAVIEQAKGMLMARSPDLTADDAFEVLRKASQRENVKLRLIAQRLVERKAPSGR
jgi:GAF domain-containing protein